MNRFTPMRFTLPPGLVAIDVGTPCPPGRCYVRTRASPDNVGVWMPATVEEQTAIDVAKELYDFTGRPGYEYMPVTPDMARSTCGGRHGLLRYPYHVSSWFILQPARDQTARPWTGQLDRTALARPAHLVSRQAIDQMMPPPLLHRRELSEHLAAQRGLDTALAALPDPFDPRRSAPDPRYRV